MSNQGRRSAVPLAARHADASKRFVDGIASQVALPVNVHGFCAFETPVGWAYRCNAILLAALALGAAAIAIGYKESNPTWMSALLLISVIVGTVAVLLDRKVEWARSAALGLTGFVTVIWGQAAAANAIRSDPRWETTLMTTATLFAGSAVVFGMQWVTPRKTARRHGAAIALVGASIVPCILFALAPGQPPMVSAAMLLGVIVLAAGAAGLGRGRTWGLLASMVGAGTLAVGVAVAPSLGTLPAGHPWLPNASVVMIDVLGASACALAFAATALYAGPVVRFLFGTTTAEHDRNAVSSSPMRRARCAPACVASPPAASRRGEVGSL